jgi:hypothetical protein
VVTLEEERDYERDLPPAREALSKVSKTTLESRLRDGTARKIVFDLCERFPECTGDYRLLYWRYLREYRGCTMSFDSLKPFFEALRAGYSPETIGRRFRELLEEAEADGDQEALEVLLPREATRVKRELNRQVFEGFYGVKPVVVLK